jgi:hypothetical protein
MRIIILLSILLHAKICASGLIDTAGTCHPAHCADGSCYCTDRINGWRNGGFACSKNGGSCGCGCFDLGMSCLNKRCPDDTREVDHPPNDRRNNEGLVCYREDPVTGGKFVLWEWFDFCYRRTVECDPKRCPFGEVLVGCGYASPGTCQKCPALAPGKFWGAKGSCTQNTCSFAASGKFVAKACTSTSDAVIADCSGYLGNKGSVVPRQDGRDTYYCPGSCPSLRIPRPLQTTPTLNASLDTISMTARARRACPVSPACMGAVTSVQRTTSPVPSP